MQVLHFALCLGERSQTKAMLKEQEVLNTVISSIDSRGIDESSRFQQWNIEPQQKNKTKKKSQRTREGQQLSKQKHHSEDIY